jgi:hypothetical protein
MIIFPLLVAEQRQEINKNINKNKNKRQLPRRGRNKIFFLTFAPRGLSTRAPEGRTQARVKKQKMLALQAKSKGKIRIKMPRRG